MWQIGPLLQVLSHIYNIYIYICEIACVILLQLNPHIEGVFGHHLAMPGRGSEIRGACPHVHEKYFVCVNYAYMRMYMYKLIQENLCSVALQILEP